MDGNALKAELLKQAHLQDGVGKHWVLNPPHKVRITTEIGRDREPLTLVVSVCKIWANCLEGTGNVFKPWWTIKEAEIL